MPLISARNPDVLDVANIEDNTSLLKKCSPVSIPNAGADDAVSVMTLHSAFQTGSGSKKPSLPVRSTRDTFSLFKRKDPKKVKEIDHQIGTDEFSEKSLPIQDSDIESVEQVWIEEQQKVDVVLQRSKKFSTQTYSDRGTVHSSLLRRNAGSDHDEVRTIDNSMATATIDNSSYVHNTSKTRGAARLLYSIRDGNIAGQATSEQIPVRKNPVKKQKKRTKPKTHPPRPRQSRRNRKPTRNENSSEISRMSETSRITEASQALSNETSQSNLEKEMFRLSLELANTLANLDISNSELAKYKVKVVQLQQTVEQLQVEKSCLREILENYEKERTSKPYSQRIGHKHDDEPVCVTPSGKNGSKDDDDTAAIFFSPGVKSYNTSFSDPTPSSRDMSGLLFPELNESHISCPDLYTSRVYDDVAATIAEEPEGKYDSEEDREITANVIDPKEEIFDDDPFATTEIRDREDKIVDPKDEVFDDDPFATSKITDPKDEVFDDDPFATMNYTDDSMHNNVDENTVASQAVSVTKRPQSVRLNASSFSTSNAFVHLSRTLPMFGKKVSDSLNTSIESQMSSMKKIANVAPSKRDSSFMNRSGLTNISRIFKFGDGKGSDDLSVSIRSHSSRHSFLKFGK